MGLQQIPELSSYLFIYLFRVRITFKHRKRIRLAKPFTNAPANKEQNLH